MSSSISDRQALVKAQQEKLLEQLNEQHAQGIKLFRWVQTHERRQDWATLKQSPGKPSPRLRIMEYVRDTLLPDVEASGEPGE